VRFEVTGGEDLVRGRSYVYVPNHRSHLDIPAVLLARPAVRFVAASELFRIPLLAGTMRALDTVPIDRKDHRRARAQLAELTASPGPLEVVVFAEGGIELAGQERPFKSGAFALALDAGAAIVPVAIHGAAEVAPPERRLLVRPGTVRVELLPVVPTEGLGRADRKRLRAEVEAAIDGALSRS
jgi:1-acyl-sn-glycerol-3-phosphate acyltransferase